MSGWAEALRAVAKDLTPGDVHVPTPNWPRKQRRKLARVLLKLAGAEGLYVARALTPECDARLREWAASQGLPPLDANLHVTVAYSRVTVEWANLQGTVSVPRSAFLRWEPLGAEGAVVLRFRSPALHARWAQARKAGATWDHGSAYKPHLTLYYNGPTPRELPDFPLEFGSEVSSPLDGDCFALQKDFDPDEHPRDSAGKFGAGGTPKPTLTPFHRKYLAEYKGANTNTNAIGLNGMLRDGHPLDQLRKGQVAHLDDAFEHHYALPGKATLYRGLTDAPVFHNGVLTNAGYTSTTSSPQVAHDYSTLLNDEGHVLEIRMPRGAKLMGMDQHASHFDASSTIGAEHEYLLPRGSAFKHISSTGNHHVVEYVAPVSKAQVRGPGGRYVSTGAEELPHAPLPGFDEAWARIPAEHRARLQEHGVTYHHDGSIGRDGEFNFMTRQVRIDPRQSSYGTSGQHTFLHETGHAMDSTLGPARGRSFSMGDKEFKAAVKADMAESPQAMRYKEGFSRYYTGDHAGTAPKEVFADLYAHHTGSTYTRFGVNGSMAEAFPKAHAHFLRALGQVSKAAFDSGEHPRDAHGQFVHGAAVAGPLPKKGKRDVVWLAEDGTPLSPEAQAHLNEIAGKGFAAPNYTQQTYYAPDPSRKGTYVGTVVDGKGRSKRFYLDANEQAKYGVKTARVRAFADGYEDYTRKLDAASATGDHDALSLRLLTKTGMRPGSDRDTGADAKAFGATNMPTSAATVEGHTVHFRFPAKNGKTYVTSVEDPLLASHVLARQAAGEPRLFDTNETKVRGLFKTLTGNSQLQLKDIRTAHGTAIAQRELMAHAFEPANEREFAQLQKTISTKVAAALQNTPKVALEKYILDGVWHGYRPHGLKLKAG